MSDNWKAAALLLTLALTGCKKDDPFAVVQARDEQRQQTLLMSDQASLLFAQQELSWAQRQAAAEPAPGDPGHRDAITAAEQHLRLAQLRFGFDEATWHQEVALDELKAYAQSIAPPDPH